MVFTFVDQNLILLNGNSICDYSNHTEAVHFALTASASENYRDLRNVSIQKNQILVNKCKNH
jgi:7-cyano-7-deazaguanine synthase in queuosine biosynthesis